MDKVNSLPFEADTNRTLEAALGYIRSGWRVIPINRDTKCPIDPETGYGMRDWQHRATTDPAQVEKWWEARPGLGIGLATGRASGIVVIDIDVSKGKTGPADLVRLEATWGPLPKTLTQSTPSGGYQLFFRYPVGVEDVPNRVGFGYTQAGHRRAAFCGIDVRGDGGQVNVPPTTRDAGAYRWCSAPQTKLPAELPARWVDALMESVRPETVEPSPFDDPDAEPASLPRGKAEGVMAGCAAIKRLQTDPRAVTEWHWKMGLGVIGRCERGRSIAHKLSALDPSRYSLADTDRGLNYMLAKSGPHSCESFAKEVPDACAACLVRGKIKSPVELGLEDPELLRLLITHVFATDAAKFYDFDRQLVKSEKDFSATFAHIPVKTRTKDRDGKWELKIARGQKSSIYMQSRLSAKADTGAYKPGETRRVYPQGRKWVANTWLDDGIPAEPGECDMWDNHVEWLLPNDEGQRDHFLNVIAFHLQHPNVNIRHATLIVSSAQQIGKSSLMNAIRDIIGKSNFITISNVELKSDFQGGMFNKEIAFFEELFIRDRDIYNETKALITEDSVRSQLKFENFADARPPILILAASNHEVPIRISEPGDERWYVIEIDRERREDAYYRSLHTKGPRQLAAWKAKLSQRDLSGFDPAAPPPMTAAKRRLISNSRNPFDRAMDEALAVHQRPVVIVDELRTALVRHGGLKASASASEVTDGLRKRGWTSRGQHKTGRGDTKGSFWTLGEDWEGARAESLREAVRWQGGPGAG